jgi:Skp family chaperone for outer membrane proteins
MSFRLPSTGKRINPGSIIGANAFVPTRNKSSEPNLQAVVNEMRESFNRIEAKSDGIQKEMRESFTHVHKNFTQVHENLAHQADTLAHQADTLSRHGNILGGLFESVVRIENGYTPQKFTKLSKFVEAVIPWLPAKDIVPHVLKRLNREREAGKAKQLDIPKRT